MQIIGVGPKLAKLSPPTRGRELKLDVPLLSGASKRVAPYAGAGIEIDNFEELDLNGSSPPTRGRELKCPVTVPQSSSCRCRPLRGGGN